MSIRLMSIVWGITFPTQSQKLLMLKLADYASDSGGSVFPANESLAVACGCDERTVQRALKVFCDAGLITLVKKGGGGPKATNEWRLNVHVLGCLSNGVVALVGGTTGLEISGEMPAEKDDILSPSKGDNKGDILSGRVTSEPVRVTRVSSKGGTGVTQSINNHHKDSSRASERASDEGARAPAAKPGPVFTLTPSESSWAHWMTWLSDRDRRDLVLAAQEAEEIVTASLWPREDSPFPKVSRAAMIERRKTGEAA